MAKRVYCLYRVSTKKQVEKDDIPMQKQKCHEFADRMGWEIVKEYSEKGVSGYKVSANDRDAVIEIRKAATAKKFDILLVFMFDRLGRREDETPFVLEWFVKNGIEVWSTMEGEQKFENHSDKLINYIRFWQASEERQQNIHTSQDPNGTDRTGRAVPGRDRSIRIPHREKGASREAEQGTL